MTGRLAGAVRERLKWLNREVHALLLAVRDGRTPWYAKLTAWAVVAYALSPIDLIPDFIPVLGLLDDLAFVPLVVVLVRRLIPADMLAECRVRADHASEAGTPVSRAGAVMIVALWVASACLAYALILGWSR